MSRGELRSTPTWPFFYTVLKCFHTGLVVPKRLASNHVWREILLDLSYKRITLTAMATEDWPVKPISATQTRKEKGSLLSAHPRKISLSERASQNSTIYVIPLFANCCKSGFDWAADAGRRIRVHETQWYVQIL